jgi:hypothetical protein
MSGYADAKAFGYTALIGKEENPKITHERLIDTSAYHISIYIILLIYYCYVFTNSAFQIQSTYTIGVALEPVEFILRFTLVTNRIGMRLFILIRIFCMSGSKMLYYSSMEDKIISSTAIAINLMALEMICSRIKKLYELIDFTKHRQALLINFIISTVQFIISIIYIVTTNKQSVNNYAMQWGWAFSLAVFYYKLIDIIDTFKIESKHPSMRMGMEWMRWVFMFVCGGYTIYITYSLSHDEENDNANILGTLLLDVAQFGISTTICLYLYGMQKTKFGDSTRVIKDREGSISSKSTTPGDTEIINEENDN